MTKATAKTPKTETSPIAGAQERFSVPLGKLLPDPKNVRRFGSEAGLAELVATIEAKGLINNLLVRPHEKKAGVYYVTAGARRLRALNEIAKAKGEIKGEPVGKDYRVPVVIADAADNAVELSLIENVARLNMHEADQIEAFRALVEDEGQTPEQIGATFGMSHMTVRRRVKLAKISPRLIEEFRAGQATLQQLEALASADTHAAQETAWFETPHYNRSADALRRMVGRDKMTNRHELVEFVTPDAYKAAGGHVEADLFDDAGNGFFDRELVTRLANAKLEAMARELEAQGWSFARHYLSATEYRRDAGLVDAPLRVVARLSETEQTEADALTLWLDENEDPDTFEEQTEWQIRSDRLDALLTPKPADYPDDWRPFIGAAVYVHGGTVVVETGLCLSDNMPQQIEAAPDARQAAKTDSAQAEPSVLISTEI